MARSSLVSRVLYDAASQTLAVTFVSGKKYLYADVPPEVASEMQTAPSLGQYFNWRIRDQYEFREIE
jgi:hypothetical protein